MINIHTKLFDELQKSVPFHHGVVDDCLSGGTRDKVDDCSNRLEQYPPHKKFKKVWKYIKKFFPYWYS
jgi:hypothetical protein